MLKLTPQTMQNGMVTKVLITDDNFREVIEITPIPFERIIQDDVKVTISRYYLKKKTCENLIQQLELAQLEFEEVKGDFDSLIRSEPKPVKIIEPSVETVKMPELKPEIPIQSIEQSKITVPEPVIKHELIMSAPEPAPKSLEEIINSIIQSEEFKNMVKNNQLSDATIRGMIVKSVKPDLLDTVYDMFMKELREKEIIEPTFFEKIENVVKKRGRKPKNKGE